MSTLNHSLRFYLTQRWERKKIQNAHPINCQVEFFMQGIRLTENSAIYPLNGEGSEGLDRFVVEPWEIRCHEFEDEMDLNITRDVFVDGS